MAECAATIVCGSYTLGGRLLEAIAHGRDRGWPAGGGAAQFAAKLRSELAVALQSTEVADALRTQVDDSLSQQAGDGPTKCPPPRSVRCVLQLITGHSRLAPGMVAPIDGRITSCERLPPPRVLLGFYDEKSQPTRKARVGLRALGLAMQARARAQQEQSAEHELSADQQRTAEPHGQSGDQKHTPNRSQGEGAAEATEKERSSAADKAADAHEIAADAHEIVVEIAADAHEIAVEEIH
jgi:hypothetical protein